MNSGIMTPKEVADYLRVSVKTVLNWANDGRIPGGKLGTSWRFEKKDLDKWLRSRLSSSTVSAEAEPIRIERWLSPERILFFSTKQKKREVLTALIDGRATRPAVESRDELAAAVFARETLLSTGIGLGVAVPHVRLQSVSAMTMAAAVVPRGIEDYDSLDGEPVKLVFMVAAKYGAHEEYIRLLSQIAKRVKDAALRDRIVNSPDAVAFCESLLQ